VKFHDGSKLTAQDVATSWNYIVFPPKGVTSARVSYYEMVDKIEAPDDATVIFRLKRATTAFLPALADPFSWIYKKETLEKDPHWYEKNILGSGPFKFAGYEVGQVIKGVRNPDYYHKGLPLLDAIEGIFADKQSVRVEALRGDRAAIEFRGLPPSARDQLVKEAGKDVVVQDSDWNCGNILTPNQKKKPFDDVRVRRALALAIDQWAGAPALAKIANVRTVGGIVFPGSPLAATKEELQQIAGFWPDIEKSRAEARRLLQEAGHPNLKLRLVNRTIDQPFIPAGIYAVDQWKKIGVVAEHAPLETKLWFAAMEGGEFDAVVQNISDFADDPTAQFNTLLSKHISAIGYSRHGDTKLDDLFTRQSQIVDRAERLKLVNEFERYALGQAYNVPLLWYQRIVVNNKKVKGWHLTPSHFTGQNLVNVWLDE
jgi:peptide/nickel transport system substrate-binding protein